MMILRVLCITAALTLTLTLTHATHVLHETTDTPAPAGWTRVDSHPPGDTLVTVTLVLAPSSSSIPALHADLLARSTPGSPLYGAHLTPTQLADSHGLAPHHVPRLLNTLARYGIPPNAVALSPTRSFARFEARLDALSALVAAPFAVWETRVPTSSPSSAAADTPARVLSVVRCARGAYSLPEDIADLVLAVGPTLRFPVVRSSSSSSSSSSGSSSFDAVTPAFLRELYGLDGVVNQVASNSVGIASFLGQYFSESDLAKFFAAYSPSDAGRSPEVHGPNKGSNPGIEASLDVQYVMAMAANVTTQAWYTKGEQPGNAENEPFLKWLADVDATGAPARIYSISYGDDEAGVTLSYAQAVNVAFMKLGLQGTTLFSSSGDAGVAGSQPPANGCTKFIPTFPAASPYVTAVGATRGSSPETAAAFSAGGFSNVWPRPAYQAAAVDAYFKHAVDLPPPSVYNHTGAGFPDISAQGVNFDVLFDGSPMPVSGTSCSSPTVAGIFSLLNGLRLAAGKPALGYLNPALYADLSPAFTDITQGSNPGCGTNGFSASVGWDPVTGLGTPNFAKLAKAVLAL